MTDDPDFWTNLSAQTVSWPVSVPGAQIRELGLVALMTVFGQDNSDAALRLERILFDGMDGLEQNQKTFAIIDAARLTNFVETVQASDLEYACLFEGNAQADMADVAPWLVQLQPNARFTRRLLDDPATPWSMWGRDAAIFVRSTADFTELQRHFRKFIRIRDMQNQWMFLRFWDPNVLLDLAACLKPDNVRKFFADHSFIAIVDDIAWQVTRNAER